MQSLHDQQVLVLGLGASGLAMARWCVRQGAHVTVLDTRESPPMLDTLKQELPHVSFAFAKMEASFLVGKTFSAVFSSPGLSPESTAALLEAARAVGTWIGGELSLFSHALKRLEADTGYAPQVLAITGTNGKTTVTALTGQLVQRAGKSVAIAGNIGPTLLDTLSAALDAQALPEVWVLELSSFQLAQTSEFEPTAAVVLNLSQDHLDWHVDMADYAQAKVKVFGSTGLMILNRQDSAVMAMLPAPVRAKLQRPVERAHMTFGVDMPQRPGDFGLEDVNGMVWLVRALEADETLKKSRNPQDQEIHIQRLIPADALRIRGRHNASNALAALALCSAAGCALGPILFGLREYRGEPHRVQAVATIGAVEYFDDSKGTNVGATVAALCGLGEERKVVIILGGEGKGQDFTLLREPVTRFARAVVLMGRDAPMIREALAELEVSIWDADSMQSAVELASEKAHDGDAVLMSPACASFDMFKNYEHRAQVFCDAVHSLALDAGIALEVQS